MKKLLSWKDNALIIRSFNQKLAVRVEIKDKNVGQSWGSCWRATGLLIVYAVDGWVKENWEESVKGSKEHKTV